MKRRMKKYKPLLMQVGILLLVLAVALYIFEHRTRFFSADFSKQYAKYRTIELSGFEDGEGWQGNYSYDTERVFEGKTSITFSSWYGAKNTIQNGKNNRLAPGYTNGYVSIFVPSEKTLSSLVDLSLQLKGDKDQQKEYALKPLMHVGWNRIAIPIPGWKIISHKSFSITSQPGTIGEVNLDRFWIENTTGYSADVFSTKSPSLSLRTIGERTYLFSSSKDGETYTLNTPQTIEKGSIIVSLIPEHTKTMRLLVNGTFMQVAGKNMNECTISDNEEKTTTKTLPTTSGKDDLYVFLKAEVQRGKVTYSVSNNGVDFEPCGTGTYSEKRPVQLFLEGSYLIDSYSAEY